MYSMIKAVLLDLDGTMLDSLDAWWQAFNDGVAVFQLEPVEKESLMKFMNDGARLAEILVGLYPELGADTGSAKITEIMESIRNMYPTNSGIRVDLAEGALDLLTLLKRKGLKTGVVTSRTMLAEKQWKELHELEVAHLIDRVVTAHNSKRKPAPDTIIKCLELLEVQPEECLIIGDSLADVGAGKAAGIKTVAVTTGVADLLTLQTHSPDFIFPSLLDMIKNLDLILDDN